MLHPPVANVLFSIFMYFCVVFHTSFLFFLGVSSSGVKPGSMNCVSEPSNNLFMNSDNTNAETKTWNPDICYSEDDLAVHVKHFIADCVQQCIMGLPSQALAAVVIGFATILGNKGDKEFGNEDGIVALEEYCKKVCICVLRFIKQLLDEVERDMNYQNRGLCCKHEVLIIHDITRKPNSIIVSILLDTCNVNSSLKESSLRDKFLLSVQP